MFAQKKTALSPAVNPLVILSPFVYNVFAQKKTPARRERLFPYIFFMILLYRQIFLQCTKILELTNYLHTVSLLFENAKISLCPLYSSISSV